MSNQMTKEDAARIQSATARNGGDMSSGGFPARAQGAAARNENAQARGTNTASTNITSTGNANNTGGKQN